MRKISAPIILILSLSFLLTLACGEKDKKEVQKNKTRTGTLEKNLAKPKKKVLFVNSYHAGYAWSDGIIKGVLDTFNIVMDRNGNLDNQDSDIELRIIYMDTKRNPDEAFIKAAAAKTKDIIDSWKPDAVIASDDNASKYLISPYYRNAKTPFIFCGVNWSASEYGFPCSNVTGMIEVFLVPQLIDTMEQYADDKRIGFIDADNTTSRKVAANYKTRFGLNLTEYFVKTFSEWKTAYKSLQDEVDMIIMSNYSGIAGWDEKAAKAFILEHTRVPTGGVIDLMAPYSMITYAMISAEQGEWSAKTTLDILNGKSPEDIPIVTNKKGKIFLNMPIAKKLGIKLPIELIERATFVEER
ncbi:MAG: ABC transporter substrate binding protein [Desulfobacteraceae bacterium]